MAFVIAFSGKGGTGKTTLAALTIRYLIDEKKKTVLAVDADPNSCLNGALGVDVLSTIGSLREESLAVIRSGQDRPGGMSTEEILDYRIQQSLVESEGFDLLVMGRPEGPGCYCAANNIIRKYTDKLSSQYAYVVIDNEAGMEHLSRRTSNSVDILLVVSDPTARGIQTAKKISQLVDELQLDVRKTAFIINRVPDADVPELVQRAERAGLTIAGVVPKDPEIESLDFTGKPVFRIGNRSLGYRAFSKLLDSFKLP